MDTKRCCTCKQYMPLDLFSRNRRNKDGLQYSCKECQKEYRREHYDNRPVDSSKECSACGITKPASEYYKDKTTKSGLRSTCAECTRAHVNSNYDYERQRRHNLKQLYGLTMEEYDEMLESQEGTCAICGLPQKQFFVDHNHETGEVRGILCAQCNGGLGFFQDKVSILENAICYLRKEVLQKCEVSL